MKKFLVLAVILIGLGIQGHCGIVIRGAVPFPINIAGVFTLIPGQNGWQVACNPPLTESCILILPLYMGQQSTIQLPDSDTQYPIQWPYTTTTGRDGTITYTFTLQH